MPATFYPESTTALPFDPPERSLIKIVAGGGSGGGGGASVTVGSGDPVGTATNGSLYWDSVGKFLYVYDQDGWNAH